MQQSEVRLSEADLGTERPIAFGVAHRYELSVEAGDLLHVHVAQLGSDVYLELLDAEETRLVRVDSRTGKEGAENLYFVFDQGGFHFLDVRAFAGSDEAGRYRAELAERRPATLRDRRLCAAELLYSRGYERVEAGLLHSELDSVITDFERAADIWAALGEETRRADALYELAPLYYSAGRLAEAFDTYEEIRPHFPAEHHRANFANEQGLIRQELGDPTGARAGFQESGELFRALGDRWNEAVALHNLGRLDNREGRPIDAIGRFEQARDLWLELDDAAQLAKTYNGIGEAYGKLGDGESAVEYHQRALSLLDPRGEPSTRATTLCFLADAHLKLDQWDPAADFFSSCLRLREEANASETARARARNGLGVVEVRRGRLDHALEHYLESIAVFERQGDLIDQAVALGNLGWLYAELGQVERALDLHRRALSLHRQLGNHAGEASSYLGLADALRRGGHLAAALERAEWALERIETLVETGQSFSSPDHLRVPYISSRRRYFDLAIQLAMDLHRVHPTVGFDAVALTISEQSRSRHLLETLAAKFSADSDRSTSELVEHQRRLRNEVNAADRQLRLVRSGLQDGSELVSRRYLSDLENQYERWVEANGRADPWLVPIYPPRPHVWREVHDLLDPSTWLLELHSGEEKSFLWLVGNNTLQTFELPPGREIDRLARRTYGMLARSDRVNFRGPAERDLRALSQMLLDPVREQLSDQRLVVVADGALQYIPFSSLPAPGREGLLLEYHEIVHAPSASVLSLLRQRSRGRPLAKGTLAMVADPVYDLGDPRLSARHRQSAVTAAKRIPFSGREAEQILSLVEGKGRARAAIGLDARRDRILAGELSEYRILHFATHGILREDSPELSALLLTSFDSAGRPLEGHLRLDEIYGLDLTAELVVLSACQSALGREVRGEGLMGLPRGFLYAGASRVVASLWQVHDESTAVLMTRFYRYLSVDGLAPAAALRRAQLSMLDDPRYAPYHHWAGFVLQGDWQSPSLFRAVR